MRAWDPVKVIDEALENHGTAGTVRSAGPYEMEGKEHAGKEYVDVQLDEGPPNTLTTFETSQLQLL